MNLIEQAERATNRGNRLSRQHWRCLREERQQEQFLAGHWKPVVTHLRRAFTREFRKAIWRPLSIQWVGSGYAVSGLTRKVSLYFHYHAYWKGTIIKRSFVPKCLDDVKVESWRLGAMLAGWGETTDEIKKILEGKKGVEAE